MPTPPIDFNAPATADESDAVRAARAFLDGGAAPAGLPLGLGEALVEALVQRGAVDRLAALATSADKALAKQARRGLHLLRSRGVKADIPAAAQRAPLVPSPAAAEQYSVVSAVVRDGERVIWYLLPDEEKTGIRVYQAAVSETEGMTGFQTGLPTRREWRESEQELMLDRNLSLVRIPGDYARWLLEEAWQGALDFGLVPPREYAEIRHQLPKAVAPARHPALDRVTEGIYTDAELARVLDLPEARTWIPDEKIAREVYQELEQMAASPLVLDERQRRQQAHELVRKACDRALGGPWRARLARRLLDTALVVALLPQRGAHEARHDRQRDHAGDAALCVAASKQVADTSLGVNEVVVARALFDRLLPKDALLDEPAVGQDPGTLIITP